MSRLVPGFAARSLATVAFVVAGFALLSSPARAQTPLLWSDSGISGTDPYGHGWLYNNEGGVDAWGVPGLNNGYAEWAGPDSLFSFSVTFTELPNGVSINTPDAGDNAGTRLQNDRTKTYWTATTDGPNTVTFTAPTGSELSAPLADGFFANVTFNGSPAGSAFTVNYNNAAAAVVPEAGTFALALPALGMIGAVVIKRRKAEKRNVWAK